MTEDEDEEPPITCDSCEHEVDEDDLDDEGICVDCREATEAQRQLESDYRFWCR